MGTGKTLAITGVNGLVGGVLAEFLSESFDVLLMSTRPGSGEVIRLDCGLPQPEPSRAVNTLIHCGGLVGGGHSREEYWAANVDFTAKLLRWSEDHGLGHFIFISTGGVYGPADDWLDETAPVNPDGYYNESKARAEELVLASAVPQVTVLRLYFPIGPFTYRHFFADMYARIENGSVFLSGLAGRPWISPVALEDLPPVLAAVARQELAGIYNLSGNKGLTMGEIIELITEAAGLCRREPKFSGDGSGDFLGRADKIIQAAGLGPFTSPEAALRRRAAEHRSVGGIS